MQKTIEIYRIPSKAGYGAKKKLTRFEFESFYLSLDKTDSWTAPLNQFDFVNVLFDLDGEVTDVERILEILSDVFSQPTTEFRAYRRNYGRDGGLHIQMPNFRVRPYNLPTIWKKLNARLIQEETGLSCDEGLKNYILEGCSKSGLENGVYRLWPNWSEPEPFPWTFNICDETMEFTKKRSAFDDIVSTPRPAKKIKGDSDENRIREIYDEIFQRTKVIYTLEDIEVLVRENFEDYELLLLFLFFLERHFSVESWNFFYSFYEREKRSEKEAKMFLKQVTPKRGYAQKTLKEVINGNEREKTFLGLSMLGVVGRMIFQSASTSDENLYVEIIPGGTDRIELNKKFLERIAFMKNEYLEIEKKERSSDDGVGLLWELKNLCLNSFLFYPDEKVQSPRYYLWKEGGWINVDENYLIECHRLLLARGLGDKINFAREIKLKSTFWRNLDLFTRFGREFVSFEDNHVFALRTKQFFRSCPLNLYSQSIPFSHNLFLRGFELADTIFSSKFVDGNSMKEEEEESRLYLRCLMLWSGGDWNTVVALLQSLREIFDVNRQKIVTHLYGERGNNGKTLFMKILGHFLGDYLRPVSSATLSSKPRETEPDLVQAAEALVAMYDEVPKDVDAEVLKRLTSNAVNFKRTLYSSDGNNATLRCSWWTTGNHEWKSTDSVALSRIRQINFPVKFLDENSVRRLRTLEEREIVLKQRSILSNTDWIEIKAYFESNPRLPMIFHESLNEESWYDRLAIGLGVVLGALLEPSAERVPFMTERERAIPRELFDIRDGGVELKLPQVLEIFLRNYNIAESNSPFDRKMEPAEFTELARSFLRTHLIGYEGDPENVVQGLVKEVLENYLYVEEEDDFSYAQKSGESRKLLALTKRQ